MSLTDVVILIPSHSLEDFPTELGDSEAASLQNAFAVAWHPRLLATTGVLPNWQRADEPTDPTEGQLFLVPTASTDWLGHDWAIRSRQAGCHVITDIDDRQEMIDAVLQALDGDIPGDATHSDSDLDTGLAETATTQPAVDADLTADFLALGTCYLQLELLTRHMHHFGNLDEVFLQREAVMAAEAAVAQDSETARAHLRSCFESLHEARERFYPVECYLVDLCLLVPDVADDHLRALLRDERPVNLLLRGADAEEMVAEQPDIGELITEAWARGTVDVIGGDYEEIPVPLVPIDSLLADLDRGRRVLKELFGREPTTWARRRFGLNPLLPQVLSRSGYHSALHFLLDDGLYPDSEQSKLRWEGCDGTVLDAMSRIPLAAEGAGSYLRFPMRMAESMEDDQAAALMLARWPEISSPFFEDLVRIHRYAPCLGRFVTLDEYFQHTDTPGRISTYAAHEYLGPFLTQAVAMRDPDPVSRYLEHITLRTRLDAASWCQSLARLLAGQPIDSEPIALLETQLESIGCESGPESRTGLSAEVDRFVSGSAADLGSLLGLTPRDPAEPVDGSLVINTLSSARTVEIPLPPDQTVADGTPGVRGIQDTSRGRRAIVDLPASGYTWLPLNSGSAAPVAGSTQLVEDLVLRNEHFEIHVNGRTGGIERIKGYGRKPNVLSQQLAFRFPRERSLRSADGSPDEETRDFYSQMVCHGVEVLSRGPHVGEIRTTGAIIDQLDGQPLATFKQTLRTVRYSPFVELDVELDITRMPEGDPWSNYFTSRFAFNDATSAVTRNTLGSAQPAGRDRFESPYFVEIANETQRVAIIAPGLPFYRRTGDRMLDAILVPEGETQRRFSLRIAVDHPYPQSASLDALIPPLQHNGLTGPPAAADHGWFFHLDAPNVQITRVLDLVEPPAWTPDVSQSADPMEPYTDEADADEAPDTYAAHDDGWTDYDHPTLPEGPGFALRLQETEGRHRSATLRCWKAPVVARQRDFQGRTLADLPIEGDAVRVDLTAHEIADIELRFDP